METNMMLKQGLHEVNKNYSKLVHAAEEAVKRRKMVQEQNIQLVKYKEQLERRLSQMQKECNRLQRKAHALDGLATLDEATIRL